MRKRRSRETKSYRLRVQKRACLHRDAWAVGGNCVGSLPRTSVSGVRIDYFVGTRRFQRYIASVCTILGAAIQAQEWCVWYPVGYQTIVQARLNTERSNRHQRRRLGENHHQTGDGCSSSWNSDIPFLTRRLRNLNTGNASNSWNNNGWSGNRGNWRTRIECRFISLPYLLGAPRLPLRCDYERFL